MTLRVDQQAKGLIFDFDGTLGDTLPIHFQAWQETARLFKFEMSESYFHQVVGLTSEVIGQAINHRQGLQLDVAQVVQCKNDIYLGLAKHVKLLRPVSELARSYWGKLPMAIGTSEYRPVALANIRATGLDRFFEIVVTADDVPHSKPEPDIFLRCAALMKVPPRFCQVFEDGAPGFAAAKKAGMILTDVRPYLREEMPA